MAPETGDVWRSELPDKTPKGVGLKQFDSWAEIPKVASVPDRANVA